MRRGVDGRVGVAGAGGGEDDPAGAAGRLVRGSPAGLDQAGVQGLHEERVRAQRGGDAGASAAGAAAASGMSCLTW